MDKQHDYQSYMLRLWRESDATPWRASLESTATGEKQGFASLSDLIAYLQSQAAPSHVMTDGDPISSAISP